MAVLQPLRWSPSQLGYSSRSCARARGDGSGRSVILGLTHFPADTPGGEGRVFTTLATDLARRTNGIHAFSADGAWRGTHLATIQSTTGCAVITPARRQTKRHGGITIGTHSYAAQPLPWSTRRAKREAACGGHQLWAAAGTLFEQVILANSSSHIAELTRHQTKRDTTVRKDGTRRHQCYARYTLPCTGREPHDWWEPLLPVQADRDAGFNRSEYLRAVPTTSDRHRRLYGMRQDTESLNAQLDRAFYGRRLPAWGTHNQTTVVLLAAIADNAWASNTWNQAVVSQHSGQPPPESHAA